MELRTMKKVFNNVISKYEYVMASKLSPKLILKIK